MRYMCESCGWSGDTKDLLEAKHPFREGEEVLGCPECKEVDNLEVACSIPYCPHKAFALNGKWYCHEHYAISKLIKVNKLRG